MRFSTNDGTIKMPKLGEAKLKAAPGIFFALLGTVIVYFSIDRTIDIHSGPVAAALRQANSVSETVGSLLSPEARDMVLRSGEFSIKCQR